MLVYCKNNTSNIGKTMKKVLSKIKIRRRDAALALAIVVLAGVCWYGYTQLGGIKKRTTSLENRLNTAGFYAESSEDIPEEKATDNLGIEVLAQADKTIKVYESVMDNGSVTEKVTEKKVRAVTVRLKNSAEYPYDFSNNLSAQVNNDGRMLTPVEPVPADQSYASTYFAIAPGGTAEATLYYGLKPGQSIVRLFDTMTQKSYEL